MGSDKVHSKNQTPLDYGLKPLVQFHETHDFNLKARKDSSVDEKLRIKSKNESQNFHISGHSHHKEYTEKFSDSIKKLK